MMMVRTLALNIFVVLKQALIDLGRVFTYEGSNISSKVVRKYYAPLRCQARCHMMFDQHNLNACL